MKNLLCDNVDEFENCISNAKAEAGEKPLILMFTGAVVESTGRSWCPDCTNAHPIIQDALKDSDAVLVTLPVHREDFRNSDLMYRTNNLISLKCVPTLMRWPNTTMRLDDSKSQKKEFIQTLLED